MSRATDAVPPVLDGAVPGEVAAPPHDRDAKSPWVEFTRREWSELAESMHVPLSDDEVSRLSGLSDPIDLAEVAEVYLPLSRLLSLYVAGNGELHRVTSKFLFEKQERTPFVIGVAGSVAVGKSTTSRVLKELMARWPESPRVELITTDGFLYANKVLEKRKLMQRKGFPESYDRRALLKFVAEVKSGAQEVRAPRYDHVSYDILPGEQIVVRKPDVLIVEGLNVLQPATLPAHGTHTPALALSDYFDFSIYVDASASSIRRWYVERFLSLRRGAFAEPGAFFHRFAGLTDEQAVALATEIWGSINEPNLRQNIEPTKGRANLVLRKGSDHSVKRIRLRKL